MKKFICMMAVVALAALTSAQALTVADFDTGDKPNNLGGDFGAWDKDPADSSQSCVEGFDEGNTRQGLGYCMRLKYDVDSENAAFNGFWMKLEQVDASPFSKLVFWAKGDASSGFTTALKVELKTPSERGATYIDGISPKWSRFEIPLADFYISDLSELNECVMVFEDRTCDPKEGVIFVDDVSLE